ncbi:hypothetical protein AMATHDRAFT_63052 [Amanita thiersii Skay4041]|uniref:AB hydrolase-1 domain-containing protein n=1 Tax=Amanita thiersii Skay4041 TaxID=703135 RepID=A0A2A9NMK1_9AGAR|nr:hypothetical protein AMATHDRAFT_63052 [Amanita thiersii Skay4041]
MDAQPDMVFVYLQGNAGNPLHRIPVFRTLITSLPRSKVDQLPRYAISAAPRSYWRSTRRSPTQQGITIDYLYTLRYTLRRFPHSHIVLYGHSLGAAAAICLLSLLRTSPCLSQEKSTFSMSSFHRTTFPIELTHDSQFSRIRGLILENPFSSIPGMVRAMYPQRWLPYHYLGPLAWDKWDAATALRSCTSPSHRDTVLARLAPQSLVLQSEFDEIVPWSMGHEVYTLAHAIRHHQAPNLQGLTGKENSKGNHEMGHFVMIPGALHDNAWTKAEWIKEVGGYLERIQREPPRGP